MSLSRSRCIAAAYSDRMKGDGRPLPTQRKSPLAGRQERLRSTNCRKLIVGMRVDRPTLIVSISPELMN